MRALFLQLEMAAKITRVVGKRKRTEVRAVVTHRDNEPPDQVLCSTWTSSHITHIFLYYAAV